jgi:hypothetical protein
VDGGRRGQCFAVGGHARLKKTTLNDRGMMYDVGRGEGRRNPGLSSYSQVDLPRSEFTFPKKIKKIPMCAKRFRFYLKGWGVTEAIKS